MKSFLFIYIFTLSFCGTEQDFLYGELLRHFIDLTKDPNGSNLLHSLIQLQSGLPFVFVFLTIYVAD